MPPPYKLLTGTSSHETLDVRGFASAYEVRALGGHDTIYGTDFGDLIVGGTGNDYQSGGLGDDFFLIEGSGQGVDNIVGGGGFDTVLGGAGDDVFDIRQFSGVERIDGGGGHNVLLGSVTNYWDLTGIEIIGISLIDLAGGSDNVTLSSGDDRFAGGAGNDTVNGGLGRDTAVYVGNFADYTLTALSGNRVRVADGANGEGTDTLKDVEVLEFADGSYEGGVFTPFGDPNNTAPVASDDTYGATEDAPLTVDAASGVIGNDTDADLDGLTVDSFDAVSANGGTVSMNADGSFTYTGAADFAGSDSFDYTVTDGRGGFSTATVDISVAGVNDAPVAVTDSYAGVSDTPVVVDAASGVLSNDTDADGDALSVDSFDAVSANGGAVSMSADGSFTYTPAAGYTGTDTFTYTVTDGNSANHTQTVSVNVSATPPVTTFDTIIAGLAENEWVKLNTNSFQDVWTPAELRAGTGNPRSVIQAWGSATWDSNRHDYIFTGGGHANYGGNEVYRWSSSTLEWERASLPSEIVNVQGAQYETIDGYENTPISSHLYDNLEFLDGADRMVSFGGAAYNTGGGFLTTDGSMNTGPYFWNPALGDPNQVGGLTGSHVDPANNPGIVGGEMWENRQTSETLGPYPDRMLNGVTDYAVINGVETVFVGEGDGHLYQYTVPDVADSGQDSWTQVGRFWSAFSG
ncbi:MAG: cadherin-like domain-containing protein, partial [Alphaproteobacteria bacterium]